MVCVNSAYSAAAETTLCRTELQLALPLVREVAAVLDGGDGGDMQGKPG